MFRDDLIKGHDLYFLLTKGYDLCWQESMVQLLVGSSGQQLKEDFFSGTPDMVEQLWMICQSDIEPNGVFEKNSYFDYSPKMAIQSSEINVGADSEALHSLLNNIAHLPPDMKREILDCLNKKHIFHGISGEDSRRGSRYLEHLDSLLGWRSSLRRKLGDSLKQNIGVTLSNSFEPPAPSPAPSSSQASESMNGPSPAEGPKQPLHSSPPGPQVLAGVPSSVSGHASVSPSGAPPGGGSNTKSVVVLAVVITALSTFLCAGFLFCLYYKCCRDANASSDGTKDERPLLTLSMSDFSIGSSEKSFPSDGLSMSKEKFRSMSFPSNSNKNGWVIDVQNSSFMPVQNGQLLTSGTSVAPATQLGSDKPISIPSHTNMSSSKPPSSPSPAPPPPPMMPLGSKPGPRPPGPPPPPPPTFPKVAKPAPPPLPKGPSPPPRPPFSSSINSKAAQTPPTGLGQSSRTEGTMLEVEAPKAKLKPFHWDKVLANPDHSMVWHQIRSGSFQFNEEMIETLFGYNTANTQKGEPKKESLRDSPSTYIQILDPKKSQNLSILLRALNVTTEEVCDALLEGNELSIELLETLLKMAPTMDEERKLRAYSGELSQLGTAERFLKALVDIPFAFKRFEALLYMGSLDEEVSCVKESFVTLEVACKELRNSRLFVKLLEAVLKTGNRMNDGTFRGGAQAFKLDTLLKLSDVKGTDGNTTLLHFVVQEIIRSEGVRAARVARHGSSISSCNSEENFEESPNEMGDHYRSLGLQVVASLGSELENVRKAAAIDADSLTNTVSRLGRGLIKIKDLVEKDMKVDQHRGFTRTVESFLAHAEPELSQLLEEEKRIMAVVKGTTDYFHGDAVKDEGLHLFVIVRDFLAMLDKVCKEVGKTPRWVSQTSKMKVAQTRVTLGPNPKHLPFPRILHRRPDSSDDDSP
ncbi:hypothetical protein AMTRI_Chr02g259960 [Amborella trichopoda]